MMKKRLISLLLAAVCLITLLAGCGGEGEETKPAQTQTVVGYVAPDLSGTKITQYMPTNSDFDPEKTWLNTAVEAYLGVDLEIVEADKLSTLLRDMVEQWNLPDLIWTNGYTHSSLGAYGEQGAFINILKYLDAMPNVKAYLEDPDNAKTVEAYTYKEGEMYAIPVKQTGSAAVYTFLYRKDIFDKHNLQWPANQEEFVAVLRKLKELYPNSQPFVLRNMQKNIQAAQVMGHLWGASHVIPGNQVFTLGEDGQYYLAPISNAYREMAQFFYDLIGEGLMNKNSLSVDTNGWQKSFYTNESFITYDKVDRLPVLNAAGRETDPEFLMTGGEPFNMGSYAKETDEVVTSFAGGVSSYAYMIGDNANLDNVLQYVDWLYSDEGRVMTNWGVEDESYIYDAQGNRMFAEGFVESVGGWENTGLCKTAISGIVDFDAYTASCEPYMQDSLAIAQKYAGKAPEQVALPFNEDEQLLMKTYASGLYQRICGEWLRFVQGQNDFAQWDEVFRDVKEIYMHDALQKAHQDAYERLKQEK